MSLRNMFMATIAPVALLAGGAPAFAQDGETSIATLEEIVVTAQRRAESVQDVPIAISAFSPAELERRNITETLDLIQYIPNLFGSNNTGLGSANAYYIRGIGNTESIATFDPPVGTYVDDVYISRQNANNLSFFDVDRVEVLRGPQGTLFGRNTTGGAVNVILKRPSDEWTGYAEVAYGRFNEITGRASIDLPVDDALMFKISGYYQDSDGYADNLRTGEEWNGGEAYGARFAARAIISDSMEWNVAVMHTASDIANILNFECGNTSLAVNCDGRFVNTPIRIDNNGANQFPGVTLANGKGNQPAGNQVDTTMVTSNLDIEIGDSATLSFITGYLKLNQKFLLDFADGRVGLASQASPEPAVAAFNQGTFVIANDGDHSQFTQEVKLNGTAFGGAVDYVAGFFYLDESNSTDFADVFVLPLAPGGFPLLLADRIMDNTTEAWAGYAQFDFNATDQLKLTAGIRYTDETKEFDFFDNRAAQTLTTDNILAATFTNGCQTAPCNYNEQTAKVWTPRFAINYQANEDVLLFASATRGFKSGGWNARGTAVNELLPFDPEKVWSYEAGLKSEWFGRTLRFNLTGFYLEVQDLQVPSAFTRANGQLAFITRNFADLENYGLEAEITWLPVDGLTINLAGGVQNASYKIDRNAPEFDEFGIRSIASQQARCLAGIAADCGVGIVTPSGDIAEPVRAPDLTLNAGISYEYEMAGAGSIIPSVNVAYTSDLESGTSNVTFYRASDGTINTAGNGEFVTGSYKDDHVVVNAGLTWVDPSRTWRATIECSNCFDEVWTQSSLANFTYISPPMTWTARLRYSF